MLVTAAHVPFAIPPEGHARLSTVRGKDLEEEMMVYLDGAWRIVWCIESTGQVWAQLAEAANTSRAWNDARFRTPFAIQREYLMLRKIPHPCCAGNSEHPN